MINNTEYKFNKALLDNYIPPVEGFKDAYDAHLDADENNVVEIGGQAWLPSSVLKLIDEEMYNAGLAEFAKTGNVEEMEEYGILKEEVKLLSL